MLWHQQVAEFTFQKLLAETSVGWLSYQWCYAATGFLRLPSQLKEPVIKDVLF